MKKKNIKTIRVCNATPHKNKALLLYDDEKYGEGFVFSHDMSRAHVTHHKLRKNPNPNDARDSIISHQLRKGKIGSNGTFGNKKYDGYYFDSKDIEDIELMYKAKKEGKPWNYYINKKACHAVESRDATTNISVKHSKYKRHKRRKSRK